MRFSIFLLFIFDLRSEGVPEKSLMKMMEHVVSVIFILFS